MLTAGTVIEGGFRLIRERPAAVAIWGLLYLVAMIAMSLTMRPIMEAQMMAIGNPEAGLAGMGAVMGRMVLVQFAFLILFIVLMTASQRAVLRPAEQGFFYLRLGMDELRMIGLGLLVAIVSYVGLLLVILVGTIAAAAFGMALGTAAAAIVGILLFFALLGVFIWLQVRFSLIFALTVARRKIVIGESWRLTRGHFWTLFGGYLAVFVIIVILAILAGLVTTGSYFYDIFANAGNPEAVQQAMQAQIQRQFGAIDAMMIFGWLISAAVGAVTLALLGGAPAAATRALLSDETVAETFA
jgi:hypothetical protein